MARAVLSLPPERLTLWRMHSLTYPLPGREATLQHPLCKQRQGGQLYLWIQTEVAKCLRLDAEQVSRTYVQRYRRYLEDLERG